MSKFAFVIVSKDDTFKLKQDTDFNFQNVDVYFVDNNSAPLTKVYNEFLHMFRTEKEADFVVFMHSDVELDVSRLIQHIEECKDKYDVIGLCGCSKFNVSQVPLNWYCGSRPFPEERWGCVTHGELGNQTSFFSHHSPDVADHEVACIDGLCIVFGPKALATDMKFDEKFKFDQYDTDISLQTVLTYRLKLGVLIQKDLKHYSVGKSILTNDFKTHEADLRKKWQI